MHPQRIEPAIGQESVWDYPRPPRHESSSDLIVVQHGNDKLAETRNSLRVLETSQPPAYYIPMDDIDTTRLRPSQSRSLCEWKGEARYFDLETDEGLIEQVGWYYMTPSGPYQALRNHAAFYAQKLTCSVNAELVAANEGNFYGGWITSAIVGPFKGGVGSSFW